MAEQEIEENENLPVERAPAIVEIQQSRAVQEVQSKLVIAKKFPRDHDVAFASIMKACKRIRLAEQAIYALPIGGTVQKGPSIRLAEVLIQSWGNAAYGIKEISRESGRSHCLAFCHDYETNMSVELEFTAEHWIEVGKKGQPKTKRILTDPVEIDRLIANRGARKVRNCILGVIPGDVVDDALKACKATLAKGDGEPLSDRIRRMLVAFSEHGITKEMIEARLDHPLDQTNGDELVDLQGIYKALVDKQAKRSDYFVTGEKVNDDATQSVADKIKAMGNENQTNIQSATAQLC
jgi:hypothetical protein